MDESMHFGEYMDYLPRAAEDRRFRIIKVTRCIVHKRRLELEECWPVSKRMPN